MVHKVGPMQSLLFQVDVIFGTTWSPESDSSFNGVSIPDDLIVMG